jgi:hypothetical protein
LQDQEAVKGTNFSRTGSNGMDACHIGLHRIGADGSVQKRKVALPENICA